MLFPRALRLLLASASAFICLATPAASGATLPPDEVNALWEIGATLGKRDWNFGVDPCSGLSNWIVPNTIKDNTNAVTCDCSFDNNTVCHVLSIYKGREPSSPYFFHLFHHSFALVPNVSGSATKSSSSTATPILPPINSVSSAASSSPEMFNFSYHWIPFLITRTKDITPAAVDSADKFIPDESRGTILLPSENHTAATVLHSR